ncbi:hypothetical protein BJV82DRAFT_605529 [Fennellomyces sp. T-0311]|nr:hypothetical protein BJV82DRAFT_605529 [Fennellomyces sp. T-0311]
MTIAERVFFIGGTGNIGSAAVKNLLRKGVPVTVFARSGPSAKKQFDNNPKLTVVEGDVNDFKSVEKSIAGHSRLFLLVGDLDNLAKIKVPIAEKAYAAGVKQIVDISAFEVSLPLRTSFLGRVHLECEEGILRIPNRKAYVALRPTKFMSNNLSFSGVGIKENNTFSDTNPPDAEQTWISTDDIGTVAANILQDPVEKHGDAVYELIGDVVTPNQRAALLTKALGRKITYNRFSEEEKLKLFMKLGFSYPLAYDVLYEPPPTGNKVTPGLSILLGRPPQTLEQWLQENKARFH